MLAVVVAPHGFTTAFASEASIVPRASHRQITPTACPGRILRAEPQVRYPLILTASHAASCRTPPSKPGVQISLHRAFQHHQGGPVRERDRFVALVVLHGDLGDRSDREPAFCDDERP